MKTLGRIIRDRRLDLGWSQIDLSRKSGLPQSSISEWENEKTDPTMTSAQRLCEALGLEIVIQQKDTSS